MGMKSFIKQLLREAIHPSMKDDNYSTHIGMKPYKERKAEFINSIQSFTDITDETIPKIIDFLGIEGFNSEEDAIEHLTESIKEYRSFPNPVTLYRIVAVKNKKLIDTNDLGEHYTPYKWAIDTHMLMSIGYENWEDTLIPYIMEIKAPLSEIDVWQTLIQNLSFPNEHEINLKNKGKGAKLIKVTKFKL